jgi:signal transduction histidine kinase
MSSGPITPGSEVQVSVAVEDISEPISGAQPSSSAEFNSGVTQTPSRSSSSSDSSGEWLALVDVAGLRRVLMNLASNALKYTPRGKITLTLEHLAMPSKSSSDTLGSQIGGNKSSNHRLVQFTMEDTGIGMSEGFQQNMFTPFSQENTFSESYLLITSVTC